MPDDDDADCAHDFELDQVLADDRGARLVHRCRLCETLSYEPSRSDQTGTGAGT